MNVGFIIIPSNFQPKRSQGFPSLISQTLQPVCRCSDLQVINRRENPVGNVSYDVVLAMLARCSSGQYVLN